jgi:organic hydroperoxide reductase OsmC/OhrA
MADKLHCYAARIRWTGNIGEGTKDYTSYKRDHEIQVDGRTAIHGSSDPAFHGNPTCYSPEDLLVASLSSCHMLWYLHLCAVAGVVVTAYVDNATGTMAERKHGGGHFKEVTLHPSVIITASSDIKLAKDLHDRAHELCFIANSVNFSVLCKAEITVVEDHAGKKVLVSSP